MAKRKSVFEDVLKFENFTGADYFEPENLLVWGSNAWDDEAGNMVRQVYLKDLTSGAIEQISAGGGLDENPKFSPDGSKILLTSAVPGKGRQLWVMDRNSGVYSQITSFAGPIMEPIWSPDGSKVLFQSPSSSNGWPPKKGEPIIIENLGYKFDGMGFFTPDSHMQLWVAEVDTGSTACISEGPYNYMHGNWSADGKSVICGTNRFREAGESIAMDLVRIDLTEGYPITRLTSEYYMVSYPNPVRPVCTPDCPSG